MIQNSNPRNKKIKIPNMQKKHLIKTNKITKKFNIDNNKHGQGAHLTKTNTIVRKFDIYKKRKEIRCESPTRHAPWP